MIRPGRDADAAGFIALIGAAWAEYPGCILDVDGEVPELRALAAYFARARGALWAAEGEDGRIIGMVGTRPLRGDAEGGWEICRMYVAAEARGTGLAQRLLGTAEAHARAAGARRLVLWTDTRFARAHAFYETRGYLRQGPIRVLDDLSKSLEFRYAKPATGTAVAVLDAAAAVSAERPLAALLAACAGEAPPGACAPEQSRPALRRLAAGVATGTQALLAGWLEGALAGMAWLDLGSAPEAAHRAALAGLLVHPAARRRGLGRALLQGAAAAAPGRRLLTGHALAATPAEAMLRAAGWTEAGRIPDWFPAADGTLRGAVLFWTRPAAAGA